MCAYRVQCSCDYSATSLTAVSFVCACCTLHNYIHVVLRFAMKCKIGRLFRVTITRVPEVWFLDWMLTLVCRLEVKILPWFRWKAQLLYQTCASSVNCDSVLLSVNCELWFDSALGSYMIYLLHLCYFCEIYDNVWQGNRKTKSAVFTLSHCINLS